MDEKGESMRAWNEPSCAGTHHSPHGLEATVEEAAVRDHCPQPLLHFLHHSLWRKYFSRALLRNMTQLHHSKTMKYRRTRTHTANIQTLHAHKRSVQHPITGAARVV